MWTKAEIRELIEARKEFNPMSGIEKLVATGEVKEAYVAKAKENWDELAYRDTHHGADIMTGAVAG